MHFSEKQCGILFFVFGMSQFLFQTPAGYLMDYTNNKIFCLAAACVITTFLTVLTASTAQDEGRNLGLMVLIKFIQGGVTALIPPGLNSITQGIVGSVGMTQQVSRNEMMNHLGTAIIMLVGSIIAFIKYPHIGILFVVSPIACLGVILFLTQINPDDIDHNAARGFAAKSATPDDTASSLSLIDSLHEPYGSTSPAKQKSYQTKPSFNFGWGGCQSNELRADSPLRVLGDTKLLVFILIVFLYHLSNGTILPLVMQSLAIGNGRTGILMSGFCIIISQLFMVMTAKICGDYSGIYGRKTLFLIGMFSGSIRCLILTILLVIIGEGEASIFMQLAILSTQLLDGLAAGVFGTMYVLVTSDISEGSGRFSLMLGLTTSAMSIGGTVSGYFGQALAQDLGYDKAFITLGIMTLLPAVIYLIFMPETLASKQNKVQDAMVTLVEKDEPEHGGSTSEIKELL